MSITQHANGVRPCPGRIRVGETTASQGEASQEDPHTYVDSDSVSAIPGLSA